MVLEVGAHLGPYEILAPVGAGGMGEVYRARDSRLDRIVAVKVIRYGSADDPSLRERLLREARAAATLAHPHVCTLHDVGRQGDVDYLVMEYVHGETWRLDWTEGRCRWTMPWRSRSSWPTPLMPLTARAWFTGISNRATSC